MIAFRRFLPLLLIGLLCGCLQESETVRPQQNFRPMAARRTIPVDEALGQLDGLLAMIDGPTTRASRRSVERVRVLRRCDLAATRSENGYPADLDSILYFVDFADDRGSAILGADNRLPAVVTVTESPIDWKRKLVDFDITRIGTGPVDTVGRTIISLVKNYIDYQVSSRGFRSWYREWEEYVPPMMRTKWTQTAPYNDYCYTVDGQKAYAGCGPIAIGQVFASNRWPNQINGYYIDWNLIERFNYDYPSPPSDDACTAVAYLIHEIGEGVLAEYKINGTFSGLGAHETFFEECGYDSVRTERYNNENIKEMLFTVQCPVVLLGYADHEDGIRKISHFWVVDGGLRRYFTLCSQVSSAGRIVEFESDAEELIVHCNFGWDGLCDGYYQSDMFDLSKPAVDYDEKLDESVPLNPPYYLFDQNLYLTMYSGYGSN